MIFSSIKLYLNATLDLIFPRICPSCQEALSNAEKHMCIFCESELLSPSTKQPNYKDRIQHPINRMYYLMTYTKKGKSQYIFNEIKYRGNKNLAKHLGTFFVNNQDYDCIIPVPLHPIKERKRGYNQAEMIARGINSKLVVKDVIKRNKNLSAFASKNKNDRWDEVEDLYSIEPQIISKGSKILLVDDILTTGATLTACVKLLAPYKPKRIDIAVAAVTTLD